MAEGDPMAHGIPALVHPALLIWARESSGLSLEEVESKAHLDSDTLLEWERGEARPTIPQLRKLGEVYKRPLAVFFLPEPPKDFDPQREFRRLPGVTPQNESTELRLALRAALFRREAARELYELLGEPLPEIRGLAHPNEDPEVVGQRIRELLGITWEEQLEWASPYTALNAWREAIENLGILVFQTGGIELEEMRGTGVTHGPLPVIVLNNADAPHGRIFTLVHEFIHILFAKGGHHTSAIEGKRLPEDQVLERASNRFAAATLMPKQPFLEELENYPDALRGSTEVLRRVANRVKVSAEAILRRLVSLQRVSTELYQQKRSDWQKHPWFSAPRGDGGPPIEVKVVSSMGRSFVALVLEGYQRNAISSGDVSDYLGVKLKYLNRVAGELLNRPPSQALR
jgi:Zn-dependent peptidase ImmA (M78 family)